MLGESQSRLYPHMRAKFWGGPTAVSKKVYLKFIKMGWVNFFLGESPSRFYMHMRAKFWRGPSAVSKKVSFNFIGLGPT